MSLLDAVEEAEKKTRIQRRRQRRAGKAPLPSAYPELSALLEDAAVPKRVHDLKLALHVLAASVSTLRGPSTTPCCSPMRSTRPTPRSRWQMLPRATTKPRRTHFPPPRLPSMRWSPALRDEAERSDVDARLRRRSICLLRLFSFAWNRAASASIPLSRRALEALRRRELERVGERIFELAGRRFNINSPKQLGEVLFTHMGLPAPVKYAARAKPFRPRRTCWKISPRSTKCPRLVLEFRHLSKLKSNLRRRASAAGRRRIARPYHVSGRRDGNGPTLVGQSESAEHSNSHRTGPRDPRRLCCRAGHATAFGRLLADRAAAAGAFQRRSAAGPRISTERRHPYAHRERSLRRSRRNHGQGNPQSRQGRELWHRLRHLAIWTRHTIRHPPGRSTRLHRSLLRALSGRQGLHREDPRIRHAAKAACAPCSAACAPFPTSRAAIPIRAALPNAPPSTPPCKAPQPI